MTSALKPDKRLTRDEPTNQQWHELVAKMTEDMNALAREIERLHAALDLICGITLGERDTGLPAGKIHRICVDALEGK